MPIGTGIPVQIYSAVAPIIISNSDQLMEQASIIVADVIRKRIEAKIPDLCNDPELLALLNKVNKLKSNLTKFDNLLNKLISISGILKTIGTTAKAISLGLTISGTPIAPAGLVKAINIIENLATNTISVSKLLVILLRQISVQLDIIISNLNRAISELNSLCNKTQTPLLAKRNININDIYDEDASIDVSLTAVGTFSSTNQIPDSIFYRDVNVSDSDLQQRFDVIDDLLNNQLDIISGIKEAPSKVISGTSSPSANDGNVGDYFINLTSGDIFGPKNLDGTWN